MPHVDIAVRLTPKAKADEIVGMRDGVLIVRVTAPPVEGKANAALCRLLARRLRVAPGRISVVKGSASRGKLVRVEGLSVLEAQRAGMR